MLLVTSVCMWLRVRHEGGKRSEGGARAARAVTPGIGTSERRSAQPKGGRACSVCVCGGAHVPMRYDVRLGVAIIW